MSILVYHNGWKGIKNDKNFVDNDDRTMLLSNNQTREMCKKYKFI